jgi:hypothetical protein
MCLSVLDDRRWRDITHLIHRVTYVLGPRRHVHIVALHAPTALYAALAHFAVLLAETRDDITGLLPPLQADVLAETYDRVDVLFHLLELLFTLVVVLN